MQATKALDILRDILANISENKAYSGTTDFMWCFGGFLEAAAGYKYSGRHSIGISYRTGFQSAPEAAIASLVQIPFPTIRRGSGSRFLFCQNRLTCRFYIASGTIILQLALFNILLPFVIVCCHYWRRPEESHSRRISDHNLHGITAGSAVFCRYSSRC